MKLITLGLTAILAVGSVGIAYASPVNLLSNGDFSATSPGKTAPTQFGSNSGSASGCGHWGGQFVTGWSGNNGYLVWYPSASAASTVSAVTQYGCAATQRLPSLVTAAPNGVATLVGLDGQDGIRGAISQTINGLTPGDKYTVSFWWASTQEMSREGSTTERFDVSMFGQTFSTGTNSIDTHGWSGWAHQSFTFTADSATGVLNFLSFGTPGNLPPFALLSDISMVHGVPEPPVLAMFGGGLLGLGLLTVFARRRALRRSAVFGDGDIG